MNAKDYSKMDEDQLATERAAIDEQIAELRAKKQAIQDVIDKRRFQSSVPAGYKLTKVGAIKSEEAHGKLGG